MAEIFVKTIKKIDIRSKASDVIIEISPKSNG